MRDTPWTLTGRFRLRTTLFGFVIMEEEWERQVFQPVSSGHTPANWRREVTWWRAAPKTIVTPP